MSLEKLLIICGVSITLTACSLSKNAQNTAKSEVQQDWTLVWSDDFDGTELDPKKWTPETSCWGGGNNEKQCYTNRSENIEVSDGVLKITAKAEPFRGLKYPQDRADRGGYVTQGYTSGKVRTKGLAFWKYGRFEARIKLPQGQSTWPAFWMFPEENQYGEWPLSGEIDIMEAVNLGAECNDCGASILENRSSAALHFGRPWPNNKHQIKANKLPKETNAFHVFAVEWSEGKFDWFVDGEKFFSLTDQNWYTDTIDKDENRLAPFDQPFYLILNLAVGGDLPDNRNEKAFNPSSFPNDLTVDWVRVYKNQ